MSVRLHLHVQHSWEHKSNQTKSVKSFLSNHFLTLLMTSPSEIAAGSSNLLQGSFISPGMRVEQPRTDPEQTPTQEALSSGATSCLHLPSQKVWDSNIIYTDIYIFLFFCPHYFQPCVWLRTPPTGPFAQPSAITWPIQRFGSITRPQRSSALKAYLSHRLLHRNLSLRLILRSHRQVGGYCLLQDDKCD